MTTLRPGITDLIRAKDELGPRVLLAIAEEASPFEHLRNRAIRDRIIHASVHARARALAERHAEAANS